MESLALPLIWVDPEANCVRFVSTKGVKGLKGGTRIEVRPIGDSALQLLKTVERPAGSQWAFPGSIDGKHYVGLPKFLGTVCARAGLKGVTIHVARHSFVALAKELGYSEFVIAGLIGHRLGGVTARYGQVPDKALVAAANDVSSVMLDALCGRSSTSLGNSRHKA
jgi:integrase